jgi:hypothetical protein
VEKLALLILILGIVGVWRWHSSANRRAYGVKMAKIQDKSKSYHCVSIRPGRDACGAAKQVIGKRFLSREAPLLPLPNCTAMPCRCHYVHHEDRREGSGDQRAPFKSRYANGSERRSGTDRRFYSRV